MRKTTGGLLALSMALYCASLFQTGYEFANSRDGSEPSGWLILLTGWLASPTENGVAWWANPLIIVAWIHLLLNKAKVAQQASLSSIVLILSFLIVKDVTVNEAGHQEKIVSYGLGYWLWLASAFAVSLAVFTVPADRK